MQAIGVSIGSNQTSVALAGTSPSTTYQFQIAASNASGVVTSPAPVTVTMPSAPLTAVATGPASIRLNWQDASTAETNLLVGFRDITSGSYDLFPGGTLSANTTNFIATNPPGFIALQPSRTYEFFIQFNVSGNRSATTPLATVTTQPLGAPQNLTAQVLSPSSIKLQWSDTSSNETGFVVSYWQQNVSSTDQFGQPAFVQFPGGTMSSNVTNFTATGLVPGDTYKFLVRSTADSSIGANSSSVTVTLPGPTSRKFHPAVVGSPIATYTVTASTFAGVADVITASNLPPGLNFTSGANQITGIPTQAGVYNTTLTAHYATWGNVSRALTFRVINPAGAPIVSAPIPKQTVNTNGALVSLPLGGFFADPDTEKAVRYVTSKGTFDVALYSTATPQTVSNYLNYVNRGDYDNTVIHRAPTSFVVQGGGYKAINSIFVKTPTDPSPTNEPGIQESAGTIAMAKLGGLPSSATDEWFFNIFDNSSILDDQSGGFTAFGRILGSGMGVINAIDSLPKATYTVTQSIGTNEFNNTFDNVPVDDVSAPPTIDFSKLVYIQTVSQISPLTYSITGNSMPQLVTASLNGSNLVVSTTNHFGGASVITITATDLEGNSVSTNVTVEINSPYTTWLNQYSLTDLAALPGANPDGDAFPNAVEFALNGSPTNADSSVVKSIPSLVTVSNQQYLALNFNMAKSLSGATVLVAGTTNVSNSNWPTVWTSNDASTNQVVQKVDQTNFWKMTVRDNTPIATNAPSRFLQLEVKLPQ